jgi:hypothetical protein
MMNTGQGGSLIAENALNFAKTAVDTATAQVDEVSRHFSDAIEKRRQPETYVGRSGGGLFAIRDLCR